MLNNGLVKILHSFSYIKILRALIVSKNTTRIFKFLKIYYTQMLRKLAICSYTIYLNN